MRYGLAVLLATTIAGCAGGPVVQENVPTSDVPPAADSAQLDGLPAQARSTELLHRAEAASAAGEWHKAARLYSQVWEHELPVDALFLTVERSRAEAMARAAGESELRDRIYMESIQERVRVLAACPEPFPADLPGEYLVHFLLSDADGRDPEQELAAADPWRVAVQLWLVRRGDSSLAPERAAALALARYGERPDLWTDAATQQLWLLAAESGMIGVTESWPQLIRPTWRRPTPGRGILAVELRQWGGGLARPLSGSGLLVDGEPPATDAAPSGRPQVLELDPGLHRVRFLAGQVHSRTVTVEIQAGTCQALVLVAIAGV